LHPAPDDGWSESIEEQPSYSGDLGCMLRPYDI
jgi:hypothetical protein